MDMSMSDAVSIVKKEGLLPVEAYESNNYIVFHVTNKQGETIGNNAVYVVDKRTKSGKWVPKSAFPLADDGDMKEYSF